MYDAALHNAKLAERRSSILTDLELRSKGYLLATVHRPQNTNIPERLSSILNAFCEMEQPIVFPAHPRTRAALSRFEISLPTNLHMIDAVGYLDMLMLERHARLVLTDSGGVQKEAFFFGVPCVTLREETEWTETVEAGWNLLAGAEQASIVSATRKLAALVEPMDIHQQSQRAIFGDGMAAERIATLLAEAAPK
jgi:UDP-N-acetylglucosamine 2-epimerase